MKTYRGSPGAARHYVEADRGRADDYYLAEGTGIAQRYVASPDTGVRPLARLTGDKYEAWVAGYDPGTGVPKGRLRTDDQAVRFVEVTVNGPKSWSLAAELHPDISAAYDGAQDRAAAQIIGWLAQHATTRVGPRGGQVQVPVQQVEAVTVRHYTSRAGDPHRHLHLQINARVLAEGRWRGLHTVGVRDSLDAINGIGHAAVMTDPGFRAALAGHGFTLNPESGEVEQLAPFVGAFSRRAAQIAANLDRYEQEWTTAHPGRTPGPGLRRGWDARAWADGRPDKIAPVPGPEVNGRWLRELADLGYVDRDKPVDLITSPVGEVDRDQAVSVVLARLGAARSGWNGADIRGEVEQFIACDGIVVESGVRGELAEDLTARTPQRCVPLLPRDGVPDHIRALTSRPVLAVEDDIVGRLAVRGAQPGHDAAVDVLTRAAGAANPADRELDAGQARAVAVLAGDRPLVVVEGAAGAGKTTTLAATRAALAGQGHALIVVTTTLKAAEAARAEVGAAAGSAAWLAYQYGWRWDRHGTWTPLMVGEVDPVTGRVYRGPHSKAVLRAGDLVLVDEAGMLDQDTARALLTLADEQHVRVGFVGDRHQLPAVGRGGVLDLAHRWADPNARVSLDVVHRFTRTIETADGRTRIVPDREYAALSAAMRTGADPGSVFDALHARDQIRIHPSESHQRQAIAADVLTARRAGMRVAVVADTRDQVTQLNAAVRARLVAAGLVDDQQVATTRAGERIGVGDVVATRRNDRNVGVANRDTWTVTGIDPTGAVRVRRGDTRNGRGDRACHPDRALPAGYLDRYVELAYAGTVHGAQGDTTTSGHLVVGEHTGAASAYVGMTRGRDSNLAHLVAADLQDAREQWIAMFARHRADLGPGHARELAAAEAARYATGRPVEAVLAEAVLAELHEAWKTQVRCLERLERGVSIRDRLAEIVALRREQPTQLAAAEQRHEQAQRAAERAKAAAERSETLITDHTSRCHEALTGEWDAQLPAAREHARTVLAGTGWFGLKLVAVNRAADELAAWSKTWQPVLPDMPTSTRHIAHYANAYLHQPYLHSAFGRYARGQAEQAHPEHPSLLHTVEQTGRELEQARRTLNATRATQCQQLNYYGRLACLEDPEQRLEQLDREIASTQHQLADAHARIGRLAAEPAIAARPPGFLTTEHGNWRTNRDTERAAGQRAADLCRELTETEAAGAVRQRTRNATIHAPTRAPAPDRGPSIGF